MKLWLLQGNIYQGKHSPPGPGTDVSDFSKVIGSTVAAKALNRHEQLLVVKQLITSPP
ncbi:10661_t:CDS:1, partial [Rhizophagus irregularis]